VDIKVARDKVGNALRDAIKQRFGDSSESLTTHAKSKMPKITSKRNSSMLWLNNTRWVGLPQSTESTQMIEQMIEFDASPQAATEVTAPGEVKFLTPSRDNESSTTSQLCQPQCAISQPLTGKNILAHNLLEYGSDGIRHGNIERLPTCGSIHSIADLFDSEIFHDQMDLEPRPIEML
jgi:hypothetical protein